MVRGGPPKKRAGPRKLRPAEPRPINFDKVTPKFCLRHLHNAYCVESLPVEKRADFAMALQHRSRMTWAQIKLADRHGMGTEKIPAKRIKASIPAEFIDSDSFLVLRYSGNLPMVGIRVQDVFHVLWIECEYGQLYDHGK